MKKSILFLSMLALLSASSYAQKKADKKTTETKTATSATPATTTAVSASSATIPPSTTIAPATTNAATAALDPDKSMKFATVEHNFNTIPESDKVSYVFEFKNIGKEAIVLSEVRPSCGCTSPEWSHDPIKPGKKSQITATFDPKGRPGPFVKTITVSSNVGVKVLKITGTVEKAPDASVPQNDNSSMKH